ncbi:ATP-dependent helicase [Candidatus Peregrinibacteria bacterium]|jgi:DNA helicase II / ATP-dependent DNA helicase PcrA|nr:ATP-dependent helicase [Candidatus Peregrinibacteria bacterium]MBT7702718.1 ATP-dependent helicase [Candidatus Peregrinibacteria bacterium]
MLNEQQKQAVETFDGPIRVLAGAGTGKTRVLISRVGHMIKTKIADSQEILILTFTNKAAQELNERLEKAELPRVHATTFHGLAAGLLRKHWKPKFKIISQKEQEDALHEIVYSHEREDLKNVVEDFNNVRQAAACEAEWPKLLSVCSLERFGEIWKAYYGILEERNAMDFTGLLTTLLQLWKDKPEVLQACQDRYKYVSVDEYQDVSPIQDFLINKLVENHKNICVVGDPDQTIYSWRGARAQTMDDFIKTYPRAQTITLTKNYRNSAHILHGAETLIKNNTNRIEKPLEPTLNGEQPITLFENRDEWQNNEVIFYLLEQFFGSHDHMASADQLDSGRDADCRSFSDIAILYRTKHEGRQIATHLEQRGYPYQKSSMPDFWEHRDIERFLEKLRAMQEAGTLPTADAEPATATAESAPPESTADAPESAATEPIAGASESAAANSQPAPNPTPQKFSDWFRDQLNKFIWNQSIPESKAERLNQLLAHAMKYDHFSIEEGVANFLDEAETAQEVDNLIYADRINLLTLHAAKGLEFPIVIIAGLEEGNLPHKKLLDDEYWLNEERRLMYVGMTRAAEQLYLLTARGRDSKQQEPSRFIAEIGTDHLTYGQLPERRAITSRRKQVKKAQTKLF